MVLGGNIMCTFLNPCAKTWLWWENGKGCHMSITKQNYGYLRKLLKPRISFNSFKSTFLILCLSMQELDIIALMENILTKYFLISVTTAS